MTRQAALGVFVFPALLLALCAPSTTAAQDGLSVRVAPRFGLVTPDAYLYEVFANFADDEPDEWTNGSLGRAAFLGLALELGQENRGLFLRGEVARTFSGWLSAVHGLVQPRVLFQPPSIAYTWLDVPATLTFANMHVVLPTQFDFLGVRPYVLAGGGGKWYEFGPPRQENTVEAILPSGGFTAALELGAGALFSVQGLSLDVQIRDSINKYWGKTQHDLVLSAAFRWLLTDQWRFWWG